MRRTIVIGDIHGCSAELQDLLRRVEATDEDKLISVGDLICKGPDSLGVMRWAMQAPNLRCVLGNHEARFLDCWRRGAVPDSKAYDLETYEQLGPEYEMCMRFIESWPLAIHEGGYRVVHAGIDPRKAWENQDRETLTNIRMLSEPSIPWFEAYAEEPLIVFGHWAAREAVIRTNAIGLDTGCVYGGALSALILPERKIVSVPARRVYREKEWRARGARSGA